MEVRCVLLLVLGACVSGLRVGAPEARLSPPVQQLVDDYFNWRVTNLPEFASLVGIHDYDDRLDDLSLAAHQSRYDQCQVFLEEAEALEANLTQQVDRVNIRALMNELLTYIEGFPFQGFLHPLCFSEGVHVDFERLISWMVFETAADYEKLLSRYNQLPEQLSQIQSLMEEGVKQGLVNHAISMKGVAESLGRFVVQTAEESPLWLPFTSFPSNVTEDEIIDFQARARTSIVEQISPAFERLRDYVANDYVTRPNIGITSVPGGVARYDQLIRFHTSTSMSAVDIHMKGLEEVGRIESEMAKIVAELGYNMSVPDFSAMIRNDSQFFYDDPDHLMRGFEELVYNVIPPRLHEVFINIPKAELKAKYEMVTLSLHEGNPGHHLQGSHGIESVNIPYFRRVDEDRNYCHAPSRFPMNTAFIEGWGLYAETLGFDMELFGDPYDRYGHYSDEIFRACRLVVDTGMHSLGWSRQSAVDFMFRHTALPLVEVENEIDRYISWPGQALAYKVGQLKLAELREEASSQLGDYFDVRKFHDVVLESVGPLELVEDEVRLWVEGGGN
ncbi:uncharacterized protein [Panulirus ornatus]|uniref:uncharacterized protein isoform X2 n=1 Tax=Panulirus ornatus TaxID=150431 RepID=UPI003A8487F6